MRTATHQWLPSPNRGPHGPHSPFAILKRDGIRERMAAVEEAVWPLPSITNKLPADPAKQVGFSDFVKDGPVVFKDVVDAYYEQTNKEFGTNYAARGRI